MNDNNLDVEVKINKKTGQYSVTIIRNGERMSCTELANDGNCINAKIVEYMSKMIGNSGDADLTSQGHKEHRMERSNPLTEEEEDDVFDPLATSPVEEDPYDAGGFGI